MILTFIIHRERRFIEFLKREGDEAFERGEVVTSYFLMSVDGGAFFSSE